MTVRRVLRHVVAIDRDTDALGEPDYGYLRRNGIGIYLAQHGRDERKAAQAHRLYHHSGDAQQHLRSRFGILGDTDGNAGLLQAPAGRTVAQRRDERALPYGLLHGVRDAPVLEPV